MEYLLSNPLIIIFGWMTITSVVATIAYYWHSAHRNDLDAALKKEMLQRGFSAEEIVQVLSAGKPKVAKDSPADPGRAHEGVARRD